MERLVNLLPQLVAQNQIMIGLLADRDGDAVEPASYLDGTRR